jgi:DNA mismatch repair ATPase MutS
LNPDILDQHSRLRVGDFYEAIDDDADTVARICNLAKTAFGDHRMAGFPHMQLERSVTALVGAGFRVATAEPVTDKPLPGKPTIARWPCAKEGRSCWRF